MSKITTRQIAKIARQSKTCHPQGIGHVVNVFADGVCIVGVSENDTIARGNGRGGWDHRIACLRYPATRADVEKIFAEYVRQAAREAASDAADRARYGD